MVIRNKKYIVSLIFSFVAIVTLLGCVDTDIQNDVVLDVKVNAQLHTSKEKIKEIFPQNHFKEAQTGTTITVTVKNTGKVEVKELEILKSMKASGIVKNNILDEHLLIFESQEFGEYRLESGEEGRFIYKFLFDENVSYVEDFFLNRVFLFYLGKKQKN